jgi:MSHA biogenesis protein MshO
MKTSPLRSAGFTLVEAIMVITITGIISAMVAVFIRKPVEGYVDAVRRAELTDTADVAMRRIARDLRLALPNSVRILPPSGGNQYVEFILTSTGGRYRDAGDGSTGGNPLSFTSTTTKTFDILGSLPSYPAIVAGTDYMVVYNLGPGYAPGDAYSGGNIALISSISGNTVTLASNPFAAQSPPLPSPNARFQIVPGGTKAVTYACPTTTPGDLNRYSNYGFNAAQAVPGNTPALLAKNVVCSFEYSPTNATGRSGLVSLRLTVYDGTTSGESVTLFSQIVLNNSP